MAGARDGGETKMGSNPHRGAPAWCPSQVVDFLHRDASDFLHRRPQTLTVTRPALEMGQGRQGQEWEEAASDG